MLTLKQKKELIKELKKREGDDYKEKYKTIINNIVDIYTDISEIRDFGYDYLEKLMSSDEEWFNQLQWVIDFEKYVFHTLQYKIDFIYLEESEIVIEYE